MKGENQRARMEGYYRLHSKIYDATRWIFLFGRKAAAAEIAARKPERILEIGCGTGANLRTLRRHSADSQLVGLDISTAMTEMAEKKMTNDPKTEIINGDYSKPVDPGGFDAVLFSYCLTMVNPGWEILLESAVADLKPGGILAVTDFHDTPIVPFRRWMAVNHVRMEGQLIPRLQKLLPDNQTTIHHAYLGFWRYFIFLGANNRSL